MKYQSINIAKKFSKINQTWSPRVIGELNDYQFKLAKLDGEFIWHHHADTDEAFLVVEGSLSIEFEDGVVQLQAGEMFVVPKGVEHRPVANDGEVKVMLIEPRGVINTGSADNVAEQAENDIWV